jgi:hypothetical protein
MRRLRRKTKDWSRNIEFEFTNIKKSFIEKYDSLSLMNLVQKNYAEMHHLLLKEEIKAKQWSRFKDINEAGGKAAHFHNVANQRRRKILVHSFNDPDGTVTVNMLDIASEFIEIY